MRLLLILAFLLSLPQIVWAQSNNGMEHAWKGLYNRYAKRERLNVEAACTKNPKIAAAYVSMKKALSERDLIHREITFQVHQLISLKGAMNQADIFIGPQLQTLYLRRISSLRAKAQAIIGRVRKSADVILAEFKKEDVKEARLFKGKAFGLRHAQLKVYQNENRFIGLAIKKASRAVQLFDCSNTRLQEIFSLLAYNRNVTRMRELCRLELRRQLIKECI